MSTTLLVKVLAVLAAAHAVIDAVLVWRVGREPRMWPPVLVMVLAFQAALLSAVDGSGWWLFWVVIGGVWAFLAFLRLATITDRADEA